MPTQMPWARLPAWLLVLSAPAAFAADSKPIALVGGQAVSAEALLQRIAKIPDFQRDALASTQAELKRRVLDTLLIPDLLLAAEAARLNLERRVSVQNREREVLRAAMDGELRRETAARSPITAEDVRGYFEANRARFETPRRIRLWRILIDDESLAKKIIADSQAVGGVQRWSAYARDSSLDKATHLRNGDLGFVHPDGNTDTPTLRVDASLFSAADTLQDGQIAPEPVKEGAHWAVLWRRGSLPAITRTVGQEEGSIRQLLQRQRLEQARSELVTQLRAKYLSRLDEAPLDSVHFDDSGLPARESALRPAHAAAAGSSVPESRERGSR